MAFKFALIYVSIKKIASLCFFPAHLDAKSKTLCVLFFKSRLHCFQGLVEFRDCEAYEPAYQTILRIAFLFFQVYRVYLHKRMEKEVS